MEIDSDQLGKGLNLIKQYCEAGITRFQDIAEDLADDLGDDFPKVWDALKIAYCAYASQATDEELGQMDDVRDVRKADLNDYLTPKDQIEEIVVNIWAIVDLGTRVVYNWAAKAYCVRGKDEYKSEFLKKLAETDYKTANRRLLPGSLKFVVGEQVLEGKISVSEFNNYFDSNIKWFVAEIEKTIPPSIIFNADPEKCKAIPQKLPESPYYVLTFLFENERGEIVPFTTRRNIKTIDSEEMKIFFEILEKKCFKPKI